MRGMRPAQLFDGGLIAVLGGFDSAGDQVWGATEGPYEFVRVRAAESGD